MVFFTSFDIYFHLSSSIHLGNFFRIHVRLSTFLNENPWKTLKDLERFLSPA